MRNCIFSLPIILTSFFAIAQETKMGFGFAYMYAPQWDKAIQTYNFSRPFLEKKQPLFGFGYNISATHLFSSQNRMKHGCSFSGSFFESRAKNENLNNILRLGLLKPAYVMHFSNPDRTSGIYAELGVSLAISVLSRKVNGSLFEYNTDRFRAYGLGGEIACKSGYRFASKSKYSFSPFIAMTYAPYLFSQNTEVVINQTQGLATEKWTPILVAIFGLSFHFSK